MTGEVVPRDMTANVHWPYNWLRKRIVDFAFQESAKEITIAINQSNYGKQLVSRFGMEMNLKRNIATDIEADRLGSNAVQIALEKASELDAQGYAEKADFWREKAAAFQEYFYDIKTEIERKSNSNPELIQIHAGIFGISITDSISIKEGMYIKPTYAHIMAPFIMAFNPALPGQGHPGPWKNASGGTAIDIYAQATLEKNVRIGNFNRLNSMWFLAALLRIKFSSSIRFPVLSDIEFKETINGRDPILWTVEQMKSIPISNQNAPINYNKDYLWISSNIERATRLMEDNGFNLALTTLDEAWFSEHRGSAMVLLWSALESLFRPGSRDITKTLSKMIATYLTAEPTARDRKFQEIRDLYNTRGEMVHAGRSPSMEAIDSTARIARLAFVKAIENDEVPDGARLQRAWLNRAAYEG